MKISYTKVCEYLGDKSEAQSAYSSQKQTREVKIDVYLKVNV